MKKNIAVEVHSLTNKLCFANNTGKLKKVVKNFSTFNSKAVTETGPIIQRTMNTEINKPIFDREK